MVGTDLAPMIADIKRISQVFQGFKSADMLEVSTYGSSRLGIRCTGIVIHYLMIQLLSLLKDTSNILL
jgi:hypothetical protein